MLTADFNMNDSRRDRQHEITNGIMRKVQIKEDRKIRARKERDKGVWFGLGMFGLVGWSVSIPTLIFLGIGVWIDRNWPSRYSWTLMMLIFGVLTGCWNAWYWVRKQSRENEK
jgi:ATP synthase protein I